MKKFFKLRNYINLFIIILIKLKYTFNNRIKFGNKVIFNGKPLIRISKGCRMILGDNVLINSRNAGYHINMFAASKLYCDREGAEIIIGKNTRIHGTCIHAYQQILIGSNCLIAANCHIFDGNGHHLSLDNPSNRINTIGGSKPIIIEDNVWIAANCIILPGTHISEGCVVAAGSIVSGFFPSRKLIRGNPALIVENNIQ